MGKIIAIADPVVDIVFSDHGTALSALPGSRVAHVAATLAQKGLPVVMVGECASDPVGDIFVSYLSKAGADVSHIDSYTDGTNPLAAIFHHEQPQQRIVSYGQWPDDRFRVIWPQIQACDVLLIGEAYSVDQPQREPLLDLVNYAQEVGATIVYLPGLSHGLPRRITHLMPAILENMELSSIVLAHDADLQTIFPGESPNQVFHNHIEFNVNHYVHLHQQGDLSWYTPSGSPLVIEGHTQLSASIRVEHAAVAIVEHIYTNGLTPKIEDCQALAQRIITNQNNLSI